MTRAYAVANNAAMQFNKWVTSQRGRSLAIAQAVGVTPPVVSDWVTGKKGIPLERCVAIEVATKGEVTRRDLRPNDWQKIWPELAQASAPAAQTGTPDTMREGTVRRQDTRRADDITVGHDRRGNDVFAQPMSQVPAQEV